jgi:hypothetical protein
MHATMYRKTVHIYSQKLYTKVSYVMFLSLKRIDKICRAKIFSDSIFSPCDVLLKHPPTGYWNTCSYFLIRPCGFLHLYTNPCHMSYIIIHFLMGLNTILAGSSCIWVYSVGEHTPEMVVLDTWQVLEDFPFSCITSFLLSWFFLLRNYRCQWMPIKSSEAGVGLAKLSRLRYSYPRFGLASAGYRGLQEAGVQYTAG